MSQKCLMLLGGIRYLLPVIEAAHKQGYYVITADNVPDNIAHQYSDEYVNVSIIDKEAVLKVATEKKIDGIMSFGVDPGVISASFVQNKLGLPSFGPFESVDILQNKDKFRAFLRKHGFNVPQAQGYDSVDAAMKDAVHFLWPVIVKPTDSAGSKGVTRIDRPEDLSSALNNAMKHSFSGHIIVEEFIEKHGCSSDTDSMSIDGKLVFTSYCAQHFDAAATNPYTPAAYSWPSTFTKAQEDNLSLEIQRLITLLGMKTALYNIETRIGTDGKPYIMELTPRGGGNRLSEMLRYATGVDMITAITRYCVSDSINEPIEQRPYNGHWAEVILHAEKEGFFDSLEIDASLPAEIIEEDLWVSKGDHVESFKGANDALGTLVLKFNTAEEMTHAITNQQEWLKVIVR